MRVYPGLGADTASLTVKGFQVTVWRLDVACTDAMLGGFPTGAVRGVSIKASYWWVLAVWTV